jgi:hypothetical protein
MTPEEWLNENLPPTETLPLARLYRDGILVSNGRAHVDGDRRRGVFWATDGAAPDLPISDASIVVDGQTFAVKDVSTCSAPLSDHWHFSLAESVQRRETV